MSEKVKIGIVGMGRMGITHFAILNTHPNVEIVSVSDTSTLILDGMRKYLPEVQTFADYKVQLQESKPDGIIVCTPPVLHFPVCELACRLGIHVFCEKPFTTEPLQAKKLAEMFSAAKLINQVGYVNRFNDVFMTVKKYLDANLLGSIIRFQSEMFSRTISNKTGGSGWRSKRENGGGVTYEMAAHALDLANYLIGAPEKITGAATSQVYSKNVEDIVSTTMLYKNGCVGLLYANWCDLSYRKPCNKLELFGTKGKLLADQYGMKIFMNQSNEQFHLQEGWNAFNITDVFTPVPFYLRGNEFTRQLYLFADRISGDGTVGQPCDFYAAYETQKIIHDIFENDANKRIG